jgi:hypothetical protein
MSPKEGDEVGQPATVEFGCDMAIYRQGPTE